MKLGPATSAMAAATILLVAPIASTTTTTQDGGEAQEASAAPPRPWASLMPPATDAEAHLALAMHAVGEGRAREALDVLDALRTPGMGGDLAHRIAVERDRVEKWLAGRAAFVDYAIAKGTKLSFTLEGKRQSVPAVGRKGDVLELAPNRAKLATLSLEEIPSAEIAMGMAKGDPAEKGSWVRAYGYAVAGDERWKKLLRDEGDEAQAFRADAEGVYPALLQTADAVAELVSLAGADAPATGADADTVLTRIQALRTTHGENRLVKEGQVPLAALARAALAARFAALGLEGVLHAKVERLEGDRVRLVYSFQKEEQREDWVEMPEYLASLRGPAGPVSPDTKSRIEMRDGALIGTGSTCLRLPLALASPTKISYELQFRKRPDSEAMACRFMLGLADDGLGSFAGCIGFGNLHVRDKLTRFEDVAYDTGEFSFYFDMLYQVEVSQDAEGKLTSSVAGEQKQELDAGARRAGGILLWFHADCSVAIHTLSIEAGLTPDSTRDLEQSWIHARLVELGLE